LEFSSTVDRGAPAITQPNASLFPAPESGSDVQEYPAWLNAILKGVMTAERGLQSVFGALPFGSSILAVAQKTSRI